MARSHFRIIGGPGKFDLMVGFFEGDGFNLQKKLAFKLEEVQDRRVLRTFEVQVTITAIQREDGSGESWNLKGCIFGTGNCDYFAAYYSTKRREGSFQFFADYNQLAAA